MQTHERVKQTQDLIESLLEEKKVRMLNGILANMMKMKKEDKNEKFEVFRFTF